MNSRTKTNPKPDLVGTTVLAAISLWRAFRMGRPSPCRFVPSCSEYARQAVLTHGGLRGSLLAARRVLRCRPGGGFGYDPVPNGPEQDQSAVQGSWGSASGSPEDSPAAAPHEVSS